MKLFRGAKKDDKGDGQGRGAAPQVTATPAINYSSNAPYDGLRFQPSARPMPPGTHRPLATPRARPPGSSNTSGTMLQLENHLSEATAKVRELEDQWNAINSTRQTESSTDEQDLLEAHLLRRLLQLKLEKERLQHNLESSEGKLAQYQSEYNNVAERHKQSIQECYRKLEDIFLSLVGVPLCQVEEQQAQDIKSQIHDFVQTFAKKFSEPEIEELQHLVEEQEKSQKQVDILQSQLLLQQQMTADYELQLIEVTEELEACKSKLEFQSKELASWKSRPGANFSNSLDPSKKDLEEILLRLNSVSISTISPQERLRIREHVRSMVQRLAALQAKADANPDASNAADAEMAEELFQMRTELESLRSKSFIKTRELEEDLESATQSFRTKLKASEEREKAKAAEIQRLRRGMDSNEDVARLESELEESRKFERDATEVLVDLRAQLESLRSLSGLQSVDAHKEQKSRGDQTRLNDADVADEMTDDIFALRAQLEDLKFQSSARTRELERELQTTRRYFQGELLASKEREHVKSEEVQRLRRALESSSEVSMRDSQVQESKEFEEDVTEILLEMRANLENLRSMSGLPTGRSDGGREPNSHDVGQLQDELREREAIEEEMTEELFELRAQLNSIKSVSAARTRELEQDLKKTRRSLQAELQASKEREQRKDAELQRLKEGLPSTEGESTDELLRELTDLRAQLENLKSVAAKHEDPITARGMSSKSLEEESKRFEERKREIERLEKELKTRRQVEEKMSEELFETKIECEGLKKVSETHSKKIRDQLEASLKDFHVELIASKEREQVLGSEVERLENELQLMEEAAAMKSEPVQTKAFLVETTEDLKRMWAQVDALKENAAAQGIEFQDMQKPDQQPIEEQLLASKSRERALEVEVEQLQKKVVELTQESIAKESLEGELDFSRETLRAARRRESLMTGQVEDLEARLANVGEVSETGNDVTNRSRPMVDQKTIQLEALQKQLAKSRKSFKAQLDVAKEREESLVKQVEDLEARLRAQGITGLDKGSSQPESLGEITLSQSTESPMSAGGRQQNKPRDIKRNRPWWKKAFGLQGQPPKSVPS